ncbi:hypothetical protein BDV29DRAFT_151661 [Aspergillus leporis]|uniref:MARVEL domain-containing protein n=1 Tax=Aspergillus leporis TaxID=41062 RepID=A0A5N5XG66_9EURO|nr:hypothetical protein BDV29DRAFT_151661 [Aspergillus leporis]
MGIFNSKWKTPLHCLQAFLVVVVIGLSIPRLFMKGQPRTRANTIGLGMGAKSLIIILYQVLTEHVAYLRKWASLKAYTILNVLEIVFWAAVVVLIIQANVNICVAPGCTLGWIVAVIGINLSALAVYASIISYRDFRRYRDSERSGGNKMARGARSDSPDSGV